MTAKDKAIELYNRFRNANGVMSANGYAKKQALICVDEIIKETGTYYTVLEGNKFVNYWERVGEEIKLLK